MAANLMGATPDERVRPQKDQVATLAGPQEPLLAVLFVSLLNV